MYIPLQPIHQYFRLSDVLEKEIEIQVFIGFCTNQSDIFTDNQRSEFLFFFVRTLKEAKNFSFFPFEIQSKMFVREYTCVAIIDDHHLSFTPGSLDFFFLSFFFLLSNTTYDVF
ncbi:hypothetical protein B9Z55_019099 [Caenorhabditis nigoni]|uniref:Uncharacterized protein n=1 Tax=Caenorhabditis nigoni TaxID=1611254 RepID=A0A2G5TH10_9PELO|nr:hypothetical protein B9Z55_019099 [Caenorhabditis nigoni]